MFPSHDNDVSKKLNQLNWTDFTIFTVRWTPLSSIKIDESGVHPYLKYLYKSVLLPTLLTMKEKPLITFMGTPSPSIEHEFKEVFESCQLRGDAIKRTILDNSSIDNNNRFKLDRFTVLGFIPWCIENSIVFEVVDLEYDLAKIPYFGLFVVCL